MAVVALRLLQSWRRDVSVHSISDISVDIFFPVSWSDNSGCIGHAPKIIQCLSDKYDHVNVEQSFNNRWLWQSDFHGILWKAKKYQIVALSKRHCPLQLLHCRGAGILIRDCDSGNVKWGLWSRLFFLQLRRIHLFSNGSALYEGHNVQTLVLCTHFSAPIAPGDALICCPAGLARLAPSFLH